MTIWPRLPLAKLVLLPALLSLSLFVAESLLSAVLVIDGLVALVALAGWLVMVRRRRNADGREQ